MVAGAADPGARVECLLDTQETAQTMYNIYEGPRVPTLWADFIAREVAQGTQST